MQGTGFHDTFEENDDLNTGLFWGENETFLYVIEFQIL